MKIKLKDSQKISINDPGKVFKIMRSILREEDKLDQGKENLWVIGTNVKNVIKYIELVHLGASNYCIIEPKQIFRTAIYYNVDSIILTHNHPSGSLLPSTDDKTLTTAIKQAGKMLGILLLDHLIISIQQKEYYSFNESGML